MDSALVIATALILVASIPVIARVRHETEHGTVFSSATVAAVWVLYSAIVAAIGLAAISSTWVIEIPEPAALPVGIVLLGIGLSMEIWGVATMASLRRMSGMQSDRLITDGAFSYSRNPQNVGIGIALLGAAVAGRSALALLATAGFWAAFYVYVRYEEDHLSRIFGSEYEDYKRRVPRFLGISQD